MNSTTRRIDGYVPIEDYALIGDGRTAALVARDGNIDWLCLPDFDSPSVFGALLDAGRGGSFDLHPAIPFESTRRYLPDTNVLETTFATAAGRVRILDAMTLPGHAIEPMRELARSIEALDGRVPMTLRIVPRFSYGADLPRCEQRCGVPVATYGSAAVAFCSWDAGRLEWNSDASLTSSFEIESGGTALVALASAHAEPLVLPSRRDIERRIAGTIDFWRGWAGARRYDGPWRGPVIRSALALKLGIFAPSGAIVAAPTTSLPEEVGGERNWDYRYCWIRDSNFVIDALLELGCHDEAQSLFWWFMQATARTEPTLHVLYALDGGPGVNERSLPLSGYRNSQPVRVGNGAAGQTQLDIYGDLVETAWLYNRAGYPLDTDVGRVLARIADRVCRIWRQPDAGIWEVRNGPFHFTHSKVMCWAALDRAIKLADCGRVPSRHADRWREEASSIERFIEDACWSDRIGSYSRAAGEHRTDASLLLMPVAGYGDPKGPRFRATLDAIERELRQGDLVYRYHADDGLSGSEGCFLNCSFWLASALARAGRIDEAERLMDALVSRANDVGLYSEEVDAATGAFLGNFPQAFVHLALVETAVAIAEARS